MDKLTRKELKTDAFVVEVEHSVDYLSHHRKQLIQYGSAALALVLVVWGVSAYRSHTQAERGAALESALQMENAPVGPAQGDALSYPTQADKDKAVNKAFTDIATKYAGSEQAGVAEYYLGAVAADKGDMAQAEKRFKLAMDSGNNAYESLAKLSLAQVYQSQGKTREGRDLIKSVIDHPTVLVSKDQATIALAELIAPSNPQEARKLLEPLRASQRSAVSRAALTALSDIPQK